MAKSGLKQAGKFHFKLKGLFFDDPKVLGAVDKSKIKIFRKWGAFVASDAKRSMKKVGPKAPPSPPGTPPRARKGLIKKFLYFLWDPKTESEIIGPQAFYENKGFQVVEAHEKGKTRRVRRRKGSGVISMKYPARPYMKPAADKNMPELPKFWHDSVKPG